MATISQDLATAILRGTALLSLAAMIVLALGWLLKLRSANTTWRAWFAVLICGLGIAPLTLQLPLLTPEAPEPAPVVEVTTVELNEVTLPEDEAVIPPIEPTPLPARPAVTAKAPIALPTPTWTWSTALVAIWAAGFAATVARGCWRYLRFARSSRACVVADDDWSAPWQRLLAEAGVRRRVPMLVGETYGPALARLPRGYALIVPRGMWGQISDEARDVILRHELAHYVRRDLVWSLVARWLAAPHWFNPLAHLAIRKLDEAAEWACDDAATGGDAERQIVLSKTLLGLSESPGAPGAMQAAMGGRVLAVRIRRILETSIAKESPMKRSAVLAALTACLLGAGLRVQLVAQEKQDDATTKESTAATKEPTLPKVPREELRYDGKSFADWQRVFQTELKTERRVEAIGAMWQFACNGYAQEAAETLVAVAGTLKQDPLGRTDNTLRETIESTLAAMEPEVVVPLLKSLLEPSVAEPAQAMALRVMANPKLRQETTLDDLAAIASDKNRPASVRSQAIRLIAGVNRPDREILQYVRTLIADSGNPMALREWMHMAVSRAPLGAGRSVNTSYFPLLIDGIASENPGLRDDAILLIAQMGPRIELILPELLELARDGKEAMAKSAAAAIVANGNEDPGTMQVLYEKLDAPQRVQLLKVIAPHYDDAKGPGWIDFFRSLRDDDHPEIRAIAEQVMESVRVRAGAAGSEQRASRAGGGR